jgi:transcriptional regulator with XRE-family HTH domain
MKETDTLFIQNLTRLRKERGYTVSKLARISGIGDSTIRNYEKGRTSPQVQDLRLLTKALKVDFNELLGGYPNNRDIDKAVKGIIEDLMIYQMENGNG